MRAHLDHCEQCQGELSRLRTTRALLSTLPAVPMPAEVATRIDAALAAELPVTQTIVPLGRRRRWRNGPTLAGAAAAAAVVLLVAALITGRVTHDNGKTSGGSSASQATNGGGAARPTPLKEWHTGDDYSPATIASLVPRLVTGTP